jgi:WhiB family redox-sensing transcriptional regulator
MAEMEQPIIDEFHGWWYYAACADVDPDLHEAYREGERGIKRRVRIKVAKAVCASCVVRNECLEDAAEKGDNHMIRGGLLPEERDRLRARDRSA